MGQFLSKHQKKTIQKQSSNINMDQYVQEKQGNIHNDYELQNQNLGKGSYGMVFKAIHKQSKIQRAIKLIKKVNCSQEEQKKLVNEVHIMKNLDHPNIIKVYEFYQDAYFFYIVTELCHGGELFERIVTSKKFNEHAAAKVMQQIFSAVYYCHKNNIVHRDIKPENLVYENTSNNSMLKVIDFGASQKFYHKQKLEQQIGTPYYIAPEVFQSQYDEKCDIWSCGVILYILLSGVPPFKGKTPQQIKEKVCKGVVLFDEEVWKDVSSNAKSFIKQLLQLNPKSRLSAKQCVVHPWIKKFTQTDKQNENYLNLTINNIKNFKLVSQLQQASWVFLINNLANKNEKERLTEIFRKMDINGDGILSKQELLDGFTQQFGQVLANKQVNEILETYGNKQKDFLSFSEFITAFIDKRRMLDTQNLQIAFKIFDTNHNGLLDLLELNNIFGQMVSQKQMDKFMEQFDTNKDGGISFTEYYSLMNLISENNEIKEIQPIQSSYQAIKSPIKIKSQKSVQ